MNWPDKNIKPISTLGSWWFVVDGKLMADNSIILDSRYKQYGKVGASGDIGGYPSEKFAQIFIDALKSNNLESLRKFNDYFKKYKRHYRF